MDIGCVNEVREVQRRILDGIAPGNPAVTVPAWPKSSAKAGNSRFGGVGVLPARDEIRNRLIGCLLY